MMNLLFNSLRSFCLRRAGALRPHKVELSYTHPRSVFTRLSGHKKHSTKKLALLTLTIVLVLALPQTTLACTGPPTGVEGDVTFNETHNVPIYCDGTNWIAMTGGDSDDGQYIPNAVNFDGGDELYEVLAASGVVDSTQATGSFWIRSNNIDSGDIFSSYIAVTPGFRIGFTTDFAFRVRGLNSSGSEVLSMRTSTSAVNYSDGQWHHILFSFDNAAGNHHLYINGVDALDFSNAPSPDPIDFFTSTQGFDFGFNLEADLADFWLDFGTYIDLSDANNRASFYNAGPVDLGTSGQLPTGTAPEFYFNGDAATWNTNLGTAGGLAYFAGTLTNSTESPGAVTSQQTQIVPNGLIGHWRLDETSGTTASDTSGNGNDGTMAGGLDGSTDSTAGRVSTALQFDGSTNQGIDVPANAAFDFAGDFSISFWMQYTGAGSDGAQRLISRQTGGAGYYFFQYSTTAQTMRFSANPGGVVNIISPAFDASKWNHFTGIRDGSTLRLFQNGVEIGSTSVSNAAYGTIVDPLLIGYRGNEAFEGIIDDTRIYNRALTPEEIQEIYLARDGIRYNANFREMEFFDGNSFVSMTPPWDEPKPTPESITVDCPNEGDVCSDGTIYAGESPDGDVPIFTSAADEGTMRWATSNVVTGFTSNTDGDGNTAGLATFAGGGDPYNAAEACHNKADNGYNDWYLPALNELQVLYANRVAIGGFDTGNEYWSSSENSSNNAREVNFADGTTSNHNKGTSGFAVRCVRKGVQEVTVNYLPNAVTFDGTNDWLENESLSESPHQIISGSFWINRDAAGIGSSETIFHSADSNGYFRIRFNTSNILVFDGRDESGGPFTTLVDTNNTFSAGQWYHVLFTLDTTNRSLDRIYINDVDQTDSTGNTMTAFGGGDRMYVGAFATGNTDKLDGSLADFWIDFGNYIDFSVEANRRQFIDASGNPVNLNTDGSGPTGSAPSIFLSGDTSTWHTNNGTLVGFIEEGELTSADGGGPGSTSQGLIGHWKLDETTGTTAVDSSGNGYDATLNAGLDAGNDNGRGAVGTAINFEGVDDYISVANNFGLTGNASVSVWFRMDNDGSDPNPFMVNFYLDNDTEWGLSINNGTNNLRLLDDTVGSEQFIYDTTITRGRWHHAVAIMENLENKLYLDGVLVGSGTDAGASIDSIGGNFYIGAKRGNWQFFKGAIDDVRIYDRALTDAEIIQLYTMGSGTAWQAQGNPSPDNPGTEVAITSLSPKRIATAWDNDNTLRIYDFDGTDWTQVGTPFDLTTLPGVGGINNDSMTALNATTVALEVGDQIRTLQYNGSTWTQIGNTASRSCSNMDLLSANRIVCQNGATLYIYDWDGINWAQFDSTDTGSDISRGDITALNATTIAVADLADGLLKTYEYAGSDWSLIGNTFSVGGGRGELTALNENTVALTLANGTLQTLTWTGTNWIRSGPNVTLASGFEAFLSTLGVNQVVVSGRDLNIQTYGFAHCNNPYGVEGSMVYNTTHDVMQFCDGERWRAIGKR